MEVSDSSKESDAELNNNFKQFVFEKPDIDNRSKLDSFFAKDKIP